MPDTAATVWRVSMWCRPWPNSWNSVVSSLWVSSAGLSPTGGVKVAHQVGHRNLHALTGFAAHPAAVHPGAAALVGSCVQIKVEAGDDLATQQLKQLYVGVIAVELLHFPDIDAVQAAHDLEQARQRPGHRQVGADILLRDLVTALAQFFAVVARYPRIPAPAGHCFAAQTPAVHAALPAPGQGLRGQLLQEGHARVRGVRHLGGQ